MGHYKNCALIPNVKVIYILFIMPHIFHNRDIIKKLKEFEGSFTSDLQCPGIVSIYLSAGH